MAQTDQFAAERPGYQWVPTMEQLAQWIADFERDGFIVLRGLLSPQEAEEMREQVVQAHNEPDPTGSTSQIYRHQMYLKGRIFEELIDRSPTVDFVEAVLGADCHMLSANTVYTGPGQGIDRWHVDETVHFPRPPDVPLDPRVPIPCFIITALYYLVDVPMELGPTQFVPGSHRSGQDARQDILEYEGRGVESVIAQAGDCLLHNGQVWHRGATNMTTDRYRVVQQVTYGRRFIAQRFYPFVNYHMPEDLLARSNPRRRRLLGVHPHGPYG